MDSKAAIAGLTPILRARLRVDEKTARDLAAAFIAASLRQTVENASSDVMAPTALNSLRVQLVIELIDQLGRTPSEAEISAMLRIQLTAARRLIAEALALSDKAQTVALRSVFARATKSGRVGGQGEIPGGDLWKFRTRDDLDLARREMERFGYRFATHERKDGNYVLLVEHDFNPASAGQ